MVPSRGAKSRAGSPEATFSRAQYPERDMGGVPPIIASPAGQCFFSFFSLPKQYVRLAQPKDEIILCLWGFLISPGSCAMSDAQR